jgi:DNA-directed RNA polymerase specialized sigma24 family protein
VVGRVDRALESLPEHYRFVLDGHERKGLCLKEIAVSLGRSEAAVRKLWARAMLALHRAVETAGGST